MNNLINVVKAGDIPANCEEVKICLKSGTVRYGYLVKTKKLSPFLFFICNQKLFKSRHADIEMIPEDQVAYIDHHLK